MCRLRSFTSLTKAGGELPNTARPAGAQPQTALSTGNQRLLTSKRTSSHTAVGAGAALARGRAGLSRPDR